MTGQQLKSSILQMAVQGKLVPQDPNDEPASVLLERIRKEKEQLIKDGKIKKEKNPSYIFRGADNLPYEKVGKNEPVCIADQVPFEIPESWEWVRHNELLQISGGSQPPKSKFISEPQNGYIRLYQIRDYGDNPIPVYIPISTASKISKKGDILLARYGASLGKVFWAEDGAYNVAMAKVIPLYKNELIYKEYLFLFYQCNLYQELIHSNSRSAQAGFNKEDLNKLFLPVPPFDEQIRIVDAYKKIQPFVTDYEKKEKILNTLNTDFPTQLKKSILQEAIQGKLVPQDPTDEPASVLLERIRAEKERLIQEGKIKRDKHESVIYRRNNSHYEKLDGIERCIDDEIPFEIPESWAWVRFSNIASFQNGDRSKNYPNRNEYVSNGVAWINTGHITSDGFLNVNTMNYITEEKYNSLSNGHIQKGDLVYCLRGATFGKVARIEPFSKGAIASSLMIIRPFDVSLRNYIYWYLRSPSAYIELHKYSNGSAQPNLAAKDVGKYLVPIPPLDEQIRIINQYIRLLAIIENI